MQKECLLNKNLMVTKLLKIYFLANSYGLDKSFVFFLLFLKRTNNTFCSNIEQNYLS